MKHLKFLLVALGLIMGFSNTNAQETATASALNNVLTAYYGVKNTLVSDDNAGAKSNAKELLATINAVPMDKLTTDQHKLWMAYQDKLLLDSKHISESGSIDHQREHFASLSKNMYEVMKGMKVNTTAIYQQYCPMKKTTWLSDAVAIKNPYYGKQMLTCGKVTETLSPATK